MTTCDGEHHKAEERQSENLYKFGRAKHLCRIGFLKWLETSVLFGSQPSAGRPPRIAGNSVQWLSPPTLF